MATAPIRYATCREAPSSVIYHRNLVPPYRYPGTFSSTAMHSQSLADVSGFSSSPPTSSHVLVPPSSPVAAAAASSSSLGCPAPPSAPVETRLFSALWEAAERYLVEQLTREPQQLLCATHILQYYQSLRVEELAYILGFCFRSSPEVLFCLSLFLPDSVLVLHPHGNSAALLCALTRQLVPEKYCVFSRLLKQQQQQSSIKDEQQQQQRHEAGLDVRRPHCQHEQQRKEPRELLQQLRALFHDSPLIACGLRKLLLHQRLYFERCTKNNANASEATFPELPIEILRPRENEPLQLHAVYRLAQHVGACSSSRSRWRSSSSFASEVLHAARMHLCGRLSFSSFSEEIDRLWCGFPSWKEHALAVKQLVAALRSTHYVSSRQTAALAQNLLHPHSAPAGPPGETGSLLTPRDACGLFLEALASSSAALRLEFDHVISSSNAYRQRFLHSAAQTSCPAAAAVSAATPPAVVTLQRLASMLTQQQQHASCERLGVLVKFFLDRRHKEKLSASTASVATAASAAAASAATAAATASAATAAATAPAATASASPTSASPTSASPASATAVASAPASPVAPSGRRAAASAAAAAAFPPVAAAETSSHSPAARAAVYVESAGARPAGFPAATKSSLEEARTFSLAATSGGRSGDQQSSSSSRKRPRFTYDQHIHALLQGRSAKLPEAREAAARAREAAAVATGFVAAAAASSSPGRAASLAATAEAIAPHVMPARCRSQQQLLDLVGLQWLPLVYILVDEWNAGLFTKQQAVEALTCIVGSDARAKSALRPLVSLFETRKLGRQRQETASLSRQRFHSWERKGTSYRRLPADWPPAISSGRDSLCCSVLNDRWASIPDNSESQARAANTHEEQLLRLEDTRYVWDLRIGRLHSLVLRLESLIKRLAAIPLQRRRFASIKPSAFTALHADALCLIFGKQAASQVLSRVCVTPLISLPVVHNTLLLKLQQWKTVRSLLDSTWRQEEVPHWEAALECRKKWRKTSQSDSDDGHACK